MIKVGNFCNIIYIEYKCNDDRNKNLSLKEYIEKIQPYLKDITIDFQGRDTWKILLAIAINFIYSKDAEERIHDL